MTATMNRTRRTDEQRIAELEARIAELKVRAERKRVQRDPALKHMSAATRSIDKAMSATNDAATRKALEEARATLAACLQMSGATVGAAPARGRRAVASFGGSAPDAQTLLDFVTRNPGQRGEQIAAALATDTKSMRPTMHKLIADKKVKTKGERRGMTYYPA